MKQYKTIAGPIELTASPDIGWEDTCKTAVKQYAAIIDAEAVGGWELLLIQQIAVKKWVFFTVIIGAIIGGALGMFVASEMRGVETPIGVLVGLLIGAVLGCLGLKKKSELFNMLVFVKDE